MTLKKLKLNWKDRVIMRILLFLLGLELRWKRHKGEGGKGRDYSFIEKKMIMQWDNVTIDQHLAQLLGRSVSSIRDRRYRYNKLKRKEK